MKVTKVNRPQLHNEEWFGKDVDFKKEVEFFGADNLGIKEQFDLFIPLHTKSDIHLELLRKSVYTQDMKKADKDRGLSFLSMDQITNHVLMMEGVDTDKKTAATRMQNLLAQYKHHGIKGGYNEESSGIYNLLQDLDAHYTAEVNLLGLAGWVESLRRAETRFLEARTLRARETADKPQEPLQEIRRKVDTLYTGMVNILETKLVVAGLGGDVVIDADDLKDGVYESDVPDHLRGNITYNFVIRWNVYAKQYRDLLAARSGRAKKKQEDSTDESEPIPPIIEL